MPLHKILKNIKSDSDRLVANKPDPDFIPYVCHYDKNTILTKNGELMKVIRVTGFSDDSMISEMSSLRDNIRSSIENNVKDDSFAFWFHTIRRKKDIAPKGVFEDFISDKINDAWVKRNRWYNQHVNEFYITVIVEGLDTSIVNFDAFMRSFSFSTTKKLHQKHLKEVKKKLNKTVNNILADIEEYGAKLLGINEWEGVLYSEPMRFFGKIINLYEDRYPLAINDISSELASHKIAFGDRKLEVVGENNKNFAAMLTLKEYQELPLDALDSILQLPFEFIITQSFDFTISPKEAGPYEHQNYILEISGDEDFNSIIGAYDFAEKEKGSKSRYGKLQTSFMFIARTKERLNNDIKRAMQLFGSMGALVVRESVFLEHCYWSQLPGNFRFLKRQRVINLSRVAGFAALHSFPSGLIAGNHWGPAVTVLNTVLNTPYFFNFHEGDLGHSLVLGPNNSGKTVFVNFMLAQARKFNNKLFYFDANSRSRCFIKALEGSCHNLSFDSNSKDLLQLNPLSLEKNDENKEFLTGWFASLVTFSKNPVPREEIDFIPQIIDNIFELNISDFSAACEVFNNKETSHIYEKLKIWSSGKLSHIFGADEESRWSDQIISFDFSQIINHKPVVIPVVNYLLHQIESNLDGNPAIIVLSEAWNLVNNTIFAPKMSDFLVRMRRKNCVVIFTSEGNEEVGLSEIIFDIKKNIATEIYLPNKEPLPFYRTILGLSDEEMDIVSMMNRQQRHFLLKNRGDSIIASVDLSKLSKMKNILASDDVENAVMEEVMELNKDESGSDPEAQTWIPQFMEVLNDIEEEQKEEQKKLIKENMLKERERLKSLE